MNIKFEDITRHIGGNEVFEKEYKTKKHFYIKNEFDFTDHFSWKDFNTYLQGYNTDYKVSRVNHLQVVTPDGRRWCHQKPTQQGFKGKFTTHYLKKLWANGSSFVLPIFESWNETMWEQCREFERHYGRGTANIYCSNKEEAYCFGVHADSTDNFIFHVDGEVEWEMYNEFGYECNPKEATIKETVTLGPGSVLYIPDRQYHRPKTLSRRMIISYHFALAHNPKYDRGPYYKWTDVA